MMLKLKGMTWDHPRGYDPLIACSQVYAEKHGVEILWDRRSLKDFGDQPLEQLIQNYDVLVIDHPHSGIAAATGALIALNDYLPAHTISMLASQSAGKSHESYEYEGQQWALAIDAAMQTSVYRDDLLEQALPQSWDGVIELGHNLKSTGHFLAMPLISTDAMCSFITLCASLGEPIGQNEKLISEAIGLKALQILWNIRDVAHPESLNWNPIQLLDAMSTQDDIVYCPLSFCYSNYARSSFRPHLLHFTNIPQMNGSILGGTGFAVSSHSNHVQEACDFGAWICSAEIQKTHYVEAGGQPGNRVAWEDPHANQLTHNFFINTLPTLQGSVIRPRHHGFTKFQEQAGFILHDCLKQDTSIAHCLTELTTLYDRYR